MGPVPELVTVVVPATVKLSNEELPTRNEPVLLLFKVALPEKLIVPLRVPVPAPLLLIVAVVKLELLILKALVLILVGADAVPPKVTSSILADDAVTVALTPKVQVESVMLLLAVKVLALPKLLPRTTRSVTVAAKILLMVDELIFAVVAKTVACAFTTAEGLIVTDATGVVADPILKNPAPLTLGEIPVIVTGPRTFTLRFVPIVIVPADTARLVLTFTVAVFPLNDKVPEFTLRVPADTVPPVILKVPELRLHVVTVRVPPDMLIVPVSVSVETAKDDASAKFLVAPAGMITLSFAPGVTVATVFPIFQLPAFVHTVDLAPVHVKSVA
jgi:hypothetical protein